MREIDNKKNPSSLQTKRSGRSERRDRKVPQQNAVKTLTGKEKSKASYAKPDSKTFVREPNTATDSTEVYENMDIHYVDDVNSFEGASQDSKSNEMIDKEKITVLNETPSDLEKESDTVSSQGDSQTAEDEKVERLSTVPVKLARKDSAEGLSRVKSDRRTDKLQMTASNNTPKKDIDSNKGPGNGTLGKMSDKNSGSMEVAPKPSSESSEGVDEKPLDGKEVDVLDEVSIGAQSIRSDDETVNEEENGAHEDQAALDQKIEEMESRIEKLEEELREVAALEISLYSVVPEHGNSAHKLHTPARRLSRLYIHACKYWSLDKRATVARNTVSGLVLVAKSCINDVPRLTFWLSNTVVLREIISEAFGSSCSSSSISKIFELNGGGKKSEGFSSIKWKGNFGRRQTNKHDLIQLVDDWKETRTFIAALEKVESWIFSRIVESIWWQTLTPNMQSPVEDSTKTKTIGRLLGPALGDQNQGNFSINLWKNAFEDAFKRLCPVRAGGNECGCLPVLARMVMEQCVSRLDVAMFNAILRESAEEIPTDPISDPIVDSKVLPIPAGDLSFGSGAQLKNSVGNWSRWLTEIYGMDAVDSPREDQHANENDAMQGPKHFQLLNQLSDLLMLPKDLLMDRSVKTEVCPSISLPLVKRILCNFTPDEFCPDPVPGAVLEEVNAECIIERRISGESSFPYNASPVVYTPPSPANVAEVLAEAGGKPQLARNLSAIQRKGYTSDEELEELESPLTSVLDESPTSPSVLSNGNRKHKDQTDKNGGNTRYDLLREVWLS
ncbi:uncharacterized protein LOC131320804 [Rhododendron vialii]|uniref:uncharacterized protein LOC131320804 n=1 Tax=Rhododendron vialii TaxID=182163 RepID=UPI00265F6B45|nr:uncharacterized protein LOC131320804 [Rhododendron vialii]XP_058207651.1 uncharacterized protein LOC131320804 [Rhododendron vialii]XP_058207652.1 uncharacterized protein LOC131320804 [Rhododendron vialii]XP_058207653.1 uncharacterized protein LOC131320804 [Rhododendron vialii]XP_058207654.1 uncharacterized protein LOC131320804 [Rhododendron vialii]